MEDEDFSKISINGRVEHKSWKARVSGYEKVQLELSKSADCEECDMLLVLRCAISDSNQVALESGLSVIVEYLKTSKDSQKNQLVSTLVEKCLSSTRSGTRSRALESLMLIVEIDGPDFVVNALLSVIDHKTPKVVSASVSAIKDVVNQFGLAKFPIKLVLKALPKIFDHKDKSVRSEGTALACEIFRWVGSSLMASLNELKPLQLKELNSLFEGLTEKASVQRYRRGFKPEFIEPIEAQTAFPSTQFELEASAPAAEVPEVYDLADPVNFISMLPKDFYSEMASEKWKERKAACETLLKLVSYPKLEDGRFYELINVLAKKLQDPNIVVVVLVANSLEKLALGLKGAFAQYRNIVLAPILDRLKEKKTNVLEALRGALDACLASISSLNDGMDDLSIAMAHSNPSVRNECIRAIARYLKNMRAKPKTSKPEIKLLVDKLLKGVDDSIPEIRDSASYAIACMMKVYTEKIITPHLDRLDKTKLAKVTDHFAKVQSGTDETIVVKSMSASQSVPMLSKAQATSTTLKKSSSSKGALSKSGSKQGSQSTPTLPVEQPIRNEFSSDSAQEWMEGAFGAEILKQLSDPAWKVRLEAITNLKGKIGEYSENKPEAIIRSLVHFVGWKESNFQVVMGMIAIFQLLAEDNKGFHKGCAALITAGVFEKIGDGKVKKVAASCLDAIVTIVSLEYVFSEAYTAIKTMKAPKIIAEALVWMMQCVTDFGSIGLKIKEFAAFVKEQLASAAAPVRTNAIALLVSVRQYGHPGFDLSVLILELRNYFNDISPALQVSIDSEFSKLTPSSTAPTKVQKAVLVAVKEETSNRIDLSTQLNHSNWKERKAGLEEVCLILERTNFCCTASLPSDLVSALKSRLTDSNKNLASASVEIIGKLAKSVGKPIDRYLRTFVPPMLSQLSDQKISVRNIVLTNLDKIVEVAGVATMLPCISTSLMTEQPQIRKDILQWLSSNSGAVNAENADSISLLPAVLACLLDRSAEVRKLAQSTLLVISISVDSNLIRSKAADLYHGSLYSSIAPYLDGLGFANVASPKASVSKISTPSEGAKGRSQTSQKSAKSATIKKEAPIQVEKVAVDSAHPIVSDDHKAKEHRQLSDRGILKWNFDTPRKELVDLLMDQAQGNFSSGLNALLFSTDHYKEKDYLAGLKLLDNFISEGGSLDHSIVMSRVIANTDLILRYLTLRFFDTNTSIFIKSLELLEHVFTILDESSYFLCDFEANSFMPYLVGKLGDPKETMRIKMRAILKMIGRIYPVSKLFTFLSKGLDSKNAKTRAECLEEMASLIQRNGQSVFVAAKSIPMVALQVGDRDAPCRNAALNVICQVYAVLGDETHKYLTKVSEKDKDMILERIRRMPAKAAIKHVAPVAVPTKRSIPQAFSAPVPSGGASSSLNVRKQFSLDLENLGMADTVVALEPVHQSSLKAPSFVDDDAVDDRLDTRLDLLLTQLNSSDKTAALEACKHLEKLLVAHPNHDVIRSRDLVGAVLPVMVSLFAQISTNNPAYLKICKHVASLLVQVFSSKDSASLVPTESLEMCMRSVLYKLVDPTLLIMDTTKTLSKALNMLMVRVIENCEPNATFRSLLLILRESSAIVAEKNNESLDIQQRYCELVMKCIWKITKVIPAFLQSESLHVELLLLDIDAFFIEAPPHFWKQKTLRSGNAQADMPLRTVKTILHELVNQLGNDIYQFTTAFPDQQNHTMHYLRQMLVKKKASPDSTRMTPKKSEATGDHSFAAQLDSIFVQIADKEESKLGIQKLFDIRKKYPSVLPLVEERLTKTGTYFQGYITRGLEALEGGALKNNDHVIRSPQGASVDYSQTLQKLQRMFNNTGEAQEAEPKPITSPQKSPLRAAIVPDVVPNSISRESRSLAVQELKERLARMKMSMSTRV